MDRCFCVCGQWFWSRAKLREHIKLHQFMQHKDHWEVTKAHHVEYLEERKERKSMGQ